MSSPAIEEDDIECQIVSIDPILVAVPMGHRLADRSRVSLTELRDEWFVGVKRGYGTRDLVDSVCKSVGFVAFIPSSARNSREEIKYLQVEKYDLVREIALLWHKSRYISQAALEFREVVVEYFGAISKQKF